MDRARLNADFARLADGDRAAFDAVFDALWSPSVGLARRLLGDAAEAEDAAQSALVRLFSEAHRYDPGRDALAWALTVTSWECRTARRKLERRREDAFVELGAEPEEDALVGADLAAAVRDLLAELRADDAETLRIVLDDAARPPVPPATFRKRVQRAVGRFSTLWRTRHGTP